VSLALPNLRMAMRVWRRNLRVYSKIWRNTLLPLFFDPLLYLMAMGFGLGTYLASINGVPYKEFIAPGLCASAVMWGSVFEVSWNAWFRMEELHLYDAMLVTPVEVEDLVAGEVLWAATRAVIYGTAFLITIAAFGLVGSWWALAMPPFLFLGGLCFATIGLAYTWLIPKMDYFTFYFTLFITPMFLFGGIFFPYDRLPDWAQVIAWFTPLYHLVEIARDLSTGPRPLSVLADTLWLGVLTAVVFVIPVRGMRRRLVA